VLKKKRFTNRTILIAYSIAIINFAATLAQADDLWISFKGGDGPGHGKKVVLVGGDEEYRSEEGLPQLAKILSKHHGFDCTVLFAIDPATGLINPDINNNIPGLEALKTADLMIIASRFRNLPEDQMKYIVDYVESGRPVIGMRTATHAFNIKKDHPYAKYSWNNKDDTTYLEGFGRQVLGETWISHHGHHGQESTRGLIAKGQEKNPILRGIKDGDVWGPTDVYGVRLPLPDDSVPLILGQVVKGMSPGDPAVEGEKNNPMMPVAWTKSYKSNSGKTARVFTTTMGSSTDLENEGLRRLLVNATYWAIGLESKITETTNVQIVGEYKPSPFKFGGYIKGRKPADYADTGKDSVPASPTVTQFDNGLPTTTPPTQVPSSAATNELPVSKEVLTTPNNTRCSACVLSAYPVCGCNQGCRRCGIRRVGVSKRSSRRMRCN
jgi:hypothetical protein